MGHETKNNMYTEQDLVPASLLDICEGSRHRVV
jgi:hypothetical protein